MRLKPLHDWAVIKRFEGEDRTPGGIIIPDAARDKPSEGIVVAIGPGGYKKIKGKERFFPTSLNPGQRVAYTGYTAKEVEVDGEQFILVREDNILGTYEGERRPALKETRVPEKRREKPLAKKETKGNVPTAPLREPRPEKKKSIEKKTARKTANTSEKKKTEKKTAKKTVKKKGMQKAVKKSVAKAKTVARKPAQKRSAGKKTGAAPLKKRTVQKRKPRPARPRKREKPGRQGSRKKTGKG